LIIAPLSIVREWVEAIQTFLPSLRYVVASGAGVVDWRRLRATAAGASAQTAIEYADIVLIALHRVRLVVNDLTRVPWHFVVVDEAHKAVSNPDTLTAQAILSIPYRGRLVLTGTPLNSDVQELWSLLRFINPDVFTDEDAGNFDAVFRRPFLAAGVGGEVDQVQLDQSERDLIVLRLHQILRPFMLRRTKLDVDASLRITFHELRCPISGVQAALLATVRGRGLVPVVVQPPTGRSSGQHSSDALLAASVARYRRSGATVQFCQGVCNHAFMHDGLPHAVRRAAAAAAAAIARKNAAAAAVAPEKGEFDHAAAATSNASGTDDAAAANTGPASSSADPAPPAAATAAPTAPVGGNLPPPPLPFLEREEDEMALRSSGKLCVLDGMLRRMAKVGRKIVVFTHYLDTIDLLSNHFIARGWGEKFVCLTGATTPDERTAAVRQYREDPDTFIFLLSMKAGGCGLNLQIADVIVLFDRDYTITNEDQAIARVFRMGQRNIVRAFYLLTDDATERRVVHLAANKDKPRKAIIEGGAYHVNAVAEANAAADTGDVVDGNEDGAEVSHPQEEETKRADNLQQKLTTCSSGGGAAGNGIIDTGCDEDEDDDGAAADAKAIESGDVELIDCRDASTLARCPSFLDRYLTAGSVPCREILARCDVEEAELEARRILWRSAFPSAVFGAPPTPVWLAPTDDGEIAGGEPRRCATQADPTAGLDDAAPAAAAPADQEVPSRTESETAAAEVIGSQQHEDAAVPCLVPADATVAGIDTSGNPSTSSTTTNTKASAVPMNLPAVPLADHPHVRSILPDLSVASFPSTSTAYVAPYDTLDAAHRVLRDFFAECEAAQATQATAAAATTHERVRRSTTYFEDEFEATSSDDGTDGSDVQSDSDSATSTDSDSSDLDDLVPPASFIRKVTTGGGDLDDAHAQYRAMIKERRLKRRRLENGAEAPGGRLAAANAKALEREAAKHAAAAARLEKAAAAKAAREAAAAAKKQNAENAKAATAAAAKKPVAKRSQKTTTTATSVDVNGGGATSTTNDAAAAVEPRVVVACPSATIIGGSSEVAPQLRCSGDGGGVCRPEPEQDAASGGATALLVATTAPHATSTVTNSTQNATIPAAATIDADACVMDVVGVAQHDHDAPSTCTATSACNGEPQADQDADAAAADACVGEVMTPQQNLISPAAESLHDEAAAVPVVVRRGRPRKVPRAARWTTRAAPPNAQNSQVPQLSGGELIASAPPVAPVSLAARVAFSASTALEGAAAVAAASGGTDTPALKDTCIEGAAAAHPPRALSPRFSSGTAHVGTTPHCPDPVEAPPACDAVDVEPAATEAKTLPSLPRKRGRPPRAS
jgi:hypothetical protein